MGGKNGGKNPPEQETLEELGAKHRDLDNQIKKLERRPHVDRQEVRKLKKQKLFLKEQIEERKRARPVPIERPISISATA